MEADAEWGLSEYCRKEEWRWDSDPRVCDCWGLDLPIVRVFAVLPWSILAHAFLSPGGYMGPVLCPVSHIVIAETGLEAHWEQIPLFMFIVDKAYSWLVFSKYLLIDGELTLKFNPLQRILCLTKAVFLLLFLDMLCSSVTMTDSHIHDYVTRRCLVLMFHFSPPLFPDSWSGQAFKSLKRWMALSVAGSIFLLCTSQL